MENHSSSVKQTVKVAIIDDEDNYRLSLKKILEQDQRILIYREYKSGKEFLRDINSPFQPDVCLIDIVLNDMSGIDCAKKFKEKHPHIHIVIMTAYPDLNTLKEARSIGADYIQKGTRTETFIDKIITTLELSKNGDLVAAINESKLSFDHLKLVEEIEQAKLRLSQLSYTQLQVLKLRKDGKSINEIAAILNVKAGTVGTHFKRALEKLQIPNMIDYIIDE